MEEVVAAVEAQGAMDVEVVDVRGKGTGMGDYFVFCSCTTPLHMRRLADMIVHAVRKETRVHSDALYRLDSAVKRSTCAPRALDDDLYRVKKNYQLYCTQQ